MKWPASSALTNDAHPHPLAAQGEAGLWLNPVIPQTSLRPQSSPSTAGAKHTTAAWRGTLMESHAGKLSSHQAPVCISDSRWWQSTVTLICEYGWHNLHPGQRRGLNLYPSSMPSTAGLPSVSKGKEYFSRGWTELSATSDLNFKIFNGSQLQLMLHRMPVEKATYSSL